MRTDAWKMDEDLKKKIVNTISTYEQKCGKLQDEIDSLKSTIHQLTGLPKGLDGGIDEELEKLRADLTTIDSATLQDRVNSLAKQIENLQSNTIQDEDKLNSYLKQSVSCLEKIVRNPADQKALNKISKVLAENKEKPEDILEHFNKFLSQCVFSIANQLGEPAIATENSDLSLCEDQFISTQVNESLQQLLDHLSIPQELNQKLSTVKIELEKQLSTVDLSKIINELTELVIEAFNLEQLRFKGFLHQLTLQLDDFSSYLQTSSDNHQQHAKDTIDLEEGIQSNIQQIRDHIDSSSNIEELAAKMGKNLESIGEKIQVFRENATLKAEVYQEEIKALNDRLTHADEEIEEFKNILSFQKYRINHDSLTGIPNREAYDEHIVDAFNRWKRGMGDLCLAVADIDHFKQINDTYGHLAGDKVLKKIALIFKSSIRSIDFVARFGGEEFVFIFEKTPMVDAYNILEKLRVGIEECQFCYRDRRVDVTVSFGLAAVDSQDDIESFFTRADEAMYKAKKQGRNRVIQA